MNCIDLFSGCGGLTLGLSRAGIRGIFAVEKSPDAFLTLQYNLMIQRTHFDWPDWLEKRSHDINVLLEEHKNDLLRYQGKVDLLAGGPPCQGFSLAGRRKKSDKRNSLVDSYIKMVEIIQPSFILLENNALDHVLMEYYVRSKSDFPMLDEMEKLLKQYGGI